MKQPKNHIARDLVAAAVVTVLVLVAGLQIRENLRGNEEARDEERARVIAGDLAFNALSRIELIKSAALNPSVPIPAFSAAGTADHLRERFINASAYQEVLGFAAAEPNGQVAVSPPDLSPIDLSPAEFPSQVLAGTAGGKEIIAIPSDRNTAGDTNVWVVVDSRLLAEQVGFSRLDQGGYRWRLTNDSGREMASSDPEPTAGAHIASVFTGPIRWTLHFEDTQEFDSDGAVLWAALIVSVLAGAVTLLAARAWSEFTARAATAADTAEKRRLRLDAVMAASPDVIFTVEPGGRLTYDRWALAALVGSDTPIDLTDLSELVHPADLNAAQSLVSSLIDAPTSRRIQLRVRALRTNGTVFPLDMTARPIPGGGGVLIARDVSAIVAAEDSLRDATAAANEANSAKSRFLSRMSHELRTPLNAISGYAQLLAEDDTLDDDNLDCAHRIVSASSHLTELISDVLDLSRVEAGEMDLTLVAVDARAVASSVASNLVPSSGSTPVTVDIAEGTNVLADERRLRQVLVNLVGNALKYAPGAPVAVTADHDGPVVTIRVADSGPGVPEDKKHRLFQPFDRLGSEGTQTEGSGVGLVLAKRIAEAMGGAIAYEDAPGGGACFAVQLLASPPAKPSGMKVVVALPEDEATAVTLACRALAADIVVVDSGEAAVQEGQDADAVLIRAFLLDMPAEEVTARLADRRAHVYVVTPQVDNADPHAADLHPLTAVSAARVLGHQFNRPDPVIP